MAGPLGRLFPRKANEEVSEQTEQLRISGPRVRSAAEPVPSDSYLSSTARPMTSVREQIHLGIYVTDPAEARPHARPPQHRISSGTFQHKSSIPVLRCRDRGSRPDSMERCRTSPRAEESDITVGKVPTWLYMVGYRTLLHRTNVSIDIACQSGYLKEFMPLFCPVSFTFTPYVMEHFVSTAFPSINPTIPNSSSHHIHSSHNQITAVFTTHNSQPPITSPKQPSQHPNPHPQTYSQSSPQSSPPTSPSPPHPTPHHVHSPSDYPQPTSVTPS